MAKCLIFADNLGQIMRKVNVGLAYSPSAQTRAATLRLCGGVSKFDKKMLLKKRLQNISTKYFARTETNRIANILGKASS